MRRALLPLALAGLLAACDADVRAPAPAAVEGDCRFTLRLPADKRLVRWDGAQVQEMPAACGTRSRCAIGSSRTAVYRLDDGEVHVQVGEHRWRVPAVRGEAVTTGRVLRGFVASRSAVARVTARELEVFTADGQRRVFPTPELDPIEGVRSVWQLGDDLVVLFGGRPGYAGVFRPPQWLTDGLTARAVPEGALPLPVRGELRGWVEPAPRGERVTRLPGGASETLVLGTVERPPHVQLLGVDAEVLVEMGWAAMRVVDGEDVALYPWRPHEESRLVLREAVFGVSLDTGLQRLTARGPVEVYGYRPGHDLSGAALPDGARVARVRAAAVNDGQGLLVVERVELPACRAEDRALLFDAQTGELTTLAGGDRLRVLPMSIAGDPAWIEADVRYSFVGAGG